MAEHVDYQFLKFSEGERGIFIKELLDVSTEMVTSLRYETMEDAAKKICEMLLQFTTADAISMTDREKVLAYKGFLEEEFPAGQEIRSRATKDVIRTGKERVVVGANELGFLDSTNDKINAAIVEPIDVAGETIGVIKLYFQDIAKLTLPQHMIAMAYAKLISSQLAVYEAEKQRESIRSIELKMLQSQINPHFLFNTINTISSLTRTDPNKAREVLREFAAFYRAVLEQDPESTTLGEELENTRKYAFLQQMRFGEDRLQFSIDVDEDLQENFNLPSFVFQPIVENSILHAMPARGVLRVSITGGREGDFVVIRISDNGTGMDEETLQSLMKDTKKDTRGLGLAMKNVHDRIKGHFDNRANVLVTSEVGKGTTTTFILPYFTSSFSTSYVS